MIASRYLVLIFWLLFSSFHKVCSRPQFLVPHSHVTNYGITTSFYECNTTNGTDCSNSSSYNTTTTTTTQTNTTTTTTSTTSTTTTSTTTTETSTSTNTTTTTSTSTTTTGTTITSTNTSTTSTTSTTTTSTSTTSTTTSTYTTRNTTTSTSTNTTSTTATTTTWDTRLGRLTFTTTTSTTSTTAKDCSLPYDPNGNYSVDETSFGANETWNLQCNPGYVVSNGVAYARCTPFGWLRRAGVCVPSNCSSYSLEQRMGGNGSTTCKPFMAAEDTCTIDCGKDVVRYGYWTCVRGQFWGSPTCLDKEGEHWKVVWTRPKIIASFDITGDLMRGVNASNATIDPFAVNITQALADALWRVTPADFARIQIDHMFESPDFIMKGWETGFPTLWKIHIFRVEFELIVWDENALTPLMSGLREVFVPGSTSRNLFIQGLLQSMNFELSDLQPNYFPLSYRETIEAPNNGLDDAAPHQAGTASLLIWVVLSASLSLLHAERQP